MEAVLKSPPVTGKKRLFHLVLCLFIVALLFPTAKAFAVSDYSWVFDNNGFFAYRLTSVSSTDLFAGSIPADNPTINLTVGKRYGVTVVNFIEHPFEFIAKGSSSSSDTVLLAMGSQQGSFETDAQVNWVDNGAGYVEFTLTTELLNAASTQTQSPGYRCLAHPDTMRGNFQQSGGGGGQPIDDPIPAPINKGSIRITMETVIEGLVSPLGVVPANDGSDRLFVYDQVGVVYVLSSDIIALKTPLVESDIFLDVRSRLVTLTAGYDERGLLGFALHPDFAVNGKVYTYTSEPVSGPGDFSPSVATAEYDHQSVIAEWTVNPLDPNAIDPATRREIMRINQPQFDHNGGEISFGPDGMLYIALGDGGNADDQGDGHSAQGNAQDLTNVYGKILRINVNGNNSANGQYGVPPDNPFVGSDGVDEIFAYGFRNPFRFSFDKLTNALIVADVGQNDIEEIDAVTKGGNYGWRYKEGSFYFDPNGDGDGFVTTVPPQPVPSGLIDPISEYDHDEGHAIVGGYVYSGTLPALQGLYIFGDFGTSFSEPSGRLFSVGSTGGVPQEFQIGTDEPLGLWLKGFGYDQSGEVYVCGSQNLGPSGNTGVVLKIADAQTSPGFTIQSTITIPLAQPATNGVWVGVQSLLNQSLINAVNIAGSVSNVSVTLTNAQYDWYLINVFDYALNAFVYARWTGFLNGDTVAPFPAATTATIHSNTTHADTAVSQNITLSSFSPSVLGDLTWVGVFRANTQSLLDISQLLYPETNTVSLGDWFPTTDEGDWHWIGVFDFGINSYVAGIWIATYEQ